jgi:lysophospholipase L1-like esterase
MALAVGVALTAYGHTAASLPAFFAGLLIAAIALGPLAFAAARYRVPDIALRIGLFASVYILALLALELVWRGVEFVKPEPAIVPVLSYEAARADPEAFRRWWNQRFRRYFEISHQFAQLDPRGLNEYVLIPGASFTRHRSQVHINELGFRGPEIERDKGDRFRIVAIGESTTFGLTILPNDRPWPEVLEARIREDYECARPVQVINAGVPGWSIGQQVKRLAYDIFPLDPDLILSYHGYNGFDFFLRPLPPLRVHEPPTQPSRPSRILEGIEREVRLWWFRRRYRVAQVADESDLVPDPMRNPYARHYRRLVEDSRREGVDVALATFNMAVNAESPEDAIRFYEETVPDVRLRIAANRIHSQVVFAIGRRFGVPVIDTSADLDGAHRDAYIDIAHFNQTGRDRLAANILDGLRETLASHPRLRCTRRRGPAASAG